MALYIPMRLILILTQMPKTWLEVTFFLFLENWNQKEFQKKKKIMFSSMKNFMCLYLLLQNMEGVAQKLDLQCPF